MMTARGTAILYIGLLIAPAPYAIAQQPQSPGTPPARSQTRLSLNELDSLVAPVALYPGSANQSANIARGGAGRGARRARAGGGRAWAGNARARGGTRRR